MIVFPKAKINIGLRIIEKRPDGYHNIETVYYPVGLRDALEAVVTEDINQKDDILTVTGKDTGCDPCENILIRSIRQLRKEYTFPLLKIHLHKTIPAGAGYGGGSSDSVYMIKLVKKYFDLDISREKLFSIALETGSDCPFFLDEKPVFASGKGEIMKPVEPVLEGLYILLLDPGIRISTREAYQQCKPYKTNTSFLNFIDQPVDQWKELITNDFEQTVFKRHPQLAIIKNELYEAGALFISMTGSGSGLYGIFTEKPSIKDDLKRMVIYEGYI